MGIAKVSNMLRMVGDYKLSNDERTMFDWLVVKQEDFGLGKPFRHSIQQVQEAINLSKYEQNKAIMHFKELGFLQVSISYFNNNPFRTYLVDFTALAKPKVLGEIIKPESKTYREFSKWINELAKEQGQPQSGKHQVDGLDLSIVPIDMLPFVEDWLAYKKEKRQPLKPIGFQSFVKLLTEMSDGCSLKAKSIIDYSIAQNYVGIVLPPSISRGQPNMEGERITDYNNTKSKNEDIWQT